jgi:hypothetical protein
MSGESMLTEAVVQISTEEIDLVDFAIEWVKVMRKLKEHQDLGELDSVSYLYLMRDIEEMLHEVTQTLLFVI